MEDVLFLYTLLSLPLLIYFLKKIFSINLKRKDYFILFALNIIIVFSITTSIFIVKNLNYSEKTILNDNSLFLIVFVILYFIFVLSPIFAIYQAFIERNKKISILLSINSFLAIIFVFSAVYYLTIGVNQFLISEEKHSFYIDKLTFGTTTQIKKKYQHAFKDEPLLWETHNINLIINDKDYKKLEHIDIHQNDKYINKLKPTLKDMSKFHKILKKHTSIYHSENVLNTYFECLYYSIVTIATLGNSMTPNIFFTKFLTALEVFYGMILLIFALSINGKCEDNKTLDDE